MTPLDTLYSAGSSARFAELVTLTTLFPETTTTITEQTQRDSSVHVETTWAVKDVQIALWKLDYYPNYVNGTGLHVAEAFRGKGLYRFLIVHVTPWWESLGLLAHTASPESPRAEYLLALGGFRAYTFRGRAVFAMVFQARDRVREYREWAQAGEPVGSEPAWYQLLKGHPVGEGEVF